MLSVVLPLLATTFKRMNENTVVCRSLVNLDVVSALENGDRLTIDDVGHYNKQPAGVWTALFRFWRGDNRRQTLDALKRDFTIVLQELQLDSSNENLVRRVQAACQGLENLVETYAGDTQMQAQLRLLLDRVRRRP